jgi:hypothetical protein
MKIQVYSLEYYYDKYTPPMLIGLFKSNEEAKIALLEDMEDVWAERCNYRIKKWTLGDEL